MICPKDLVQMHQYKQIGKGIAEDDNYDTWELKECPICGRIVKEGYYCKLLTGDQVAKIENEFYPVPF